MIYPQLRHLMTLDSMAAALLLIIAFAGIPACMSLEVRASVGCLDEMSTSWYLNCSVPTSNIRHLNMLQWQRGPPPRTSKFDFTMNAINNERLNNPRVQRVRIVNQHTLSVVVKSVSEEDLTSWTCVIRDADWKEYKSSEISMTSTCGPQPTVVPPPEASVFSTPVWIGLITAAVGVIIIVVIIIICCCYKRRPNKRKQRNSEQQEPTTQTHNDEEEGATAPLMRNNNPGIVAEQQETGTVQNQEDKAGTTAAKIFNLDYSGKPPRPRVEVHPRVSLQDIEMQDMTSSPTLKKALHVDMATSPMPQTNEEQMFWRNGAACAFDRTATDGACAAYGTATDGPGLANVRQQNNQTSDTAQRSTEAVERVREFTERVGSGQVSTNTGGSGQESTDAAGSSQESTGVRSGQESTNTAGSGQESPEGVRSGQESTDAAGNGQESTEGVRSGQESTNSAGTDYESPNVAQNELLRRNEDPDRRHICRNRPKTFPLKHSPVCTDCHDGKI